MGIGVAFEPAEVNNPMDGDLDIPACREIAEKALASVKELLEAEDVPHKIRWYNLQARNGDPWTTFGFTLILLGYAKGAMDLDYQWEKSPGSAEPDKIHGGSYAKTQFAQDPYRTHTLMCQILRKWKNEGLATWIWDDVGYLEKEEKTTQDMEIE